MAAPEYVPIDRTDAPRTGLALPPAQRWAPSDADHLGPRPADLGPEQPTGPRLGSPGPDQGFALRLANGFADKVLLRTGEKWDDVKAGAVLIAMKRAALFGRAPVVHDLTVAFTLWGYLDASPDADLVEARTARFAGASHHHHYGDTRALVDTVPESTLRLAPAQVSAGQWRSLLALG